MKWNSTLKKFVIEKLGGFSNASDAIDAISSVEERRELLTRAVRRHFNIVCADDILRRHEGAWFYQGKPLRKDQMQLLQAEATQLLSSKLWEILSDDIRWVSNRQMFDGAKTVDDIIVGKSWLFVLRELQKRLEQIQSEII